MWGAQSRVEAAVRALRRGLPAIVLDDRERENEGDFVLLAEHATPEVVHFMLREGRGLLCAPVDVERARELALAPMVADSQDPKETAFTVSVDHVSVKTGISARERALTLRALADASARPEDFRRPGHVFPLVARPGGVRERRGHTEAAIELARLAGARPAAAIIEILDDSGEPASLSYLERLAARENLPFLTVEDIARVVAALHGERSGTVGLPPASPSSAKAADVAPSALLPRLERSDVVHLPSEYGAFRAVAYRESAIAFPAPGNCAVREHIALWKGEISSDRPILVRVHSECLTGDVFGSYRCDCGPQLETALARIEAEGGILVYLRQEGRGIGLYEKLRAYALQERGFDTVDANLVLGHPVDARDYDVAAAILHDLGVRRVRLLTNNPEKVEALRQFGIEVVERVPLEIPPREENRRYLEAKKHRLGHLLSHL
ncbi:MAG: 3,4-dihydroxy-2-butanone 4-phosphate synthase [Brockia lithotrophica]|uniref:GTP cyclohydrolase-2 n=1 Tax=Brockia lithotrophica TaxID=933949 RepID=A0A2T5GAB2_9BACL|nr:GTP cyclohydrolase II [Brockia lithotrophica]PTQ53124.1 MAG: 3,4-dihydroxy-2-butanone 4-phosphate synthase [Brockia lithotrophica]